MTDKTTPPGGKKSPLSNRVTSNPKIVVKKEPPSSPSLGPNGRHRPRRLDLNTTTNIPAPLSSRPSAGASMHDVGLACLSPGFQTHDPTMREQLQRSISVRDQQRSIIEARMLKSAKGDQPQAPESAKPLDNPNPFARGPPTGKKRPPPAGLSIVPPRAEQFANERVIQSAPLGKTFTGRDQPPPSIREPHHHQQAQQINHVPAIQTNNRLPPISDVFGQDTLQPQRPPLFHNNSTPSHQHHGPPLPSPGFPPQTAHPMSQPPPPNFERPREYRSAEEAVAELTGGRPDLQPRVIHYNGRSPPTPPSPQPHRNDHLTPHKYQTQQADSGASRRRTRNEYEADSSPPLGTQPARTGPFGAGRDSPATQQAKKDEFLSLMSRAWDLFHN